MFTTEYGVASLGLAQIPYQAVAYIRVRSCAPGKTDELIAQCVAFCRACGAERIFAAGEGLQHYPLDCTILELRGSVSEGECATLRPVTHENYELWRQIANERMASVDHHATITHDFARDLPQSGGAYFVCDGETMLGIGLVQGQTLQLLASTQRGAGERVLRTLMKVLPREGFRLEVASTNLPARALYARLGFSVSAEKVRWYRVFSKFA